MSKYLEWFKSTVGHTHMQEQAKEEITQLRERVKELEGENKGLSIRISTQRETIRKYQKEVEQLRKGGES